MIKDIKKHKAFSLLEVIFVLVILGIVSSIGSSILVQVYESYITQNAVYKVNMKTELASQQIVNRLSYAIPGTTISKDLTNLGFVESVNWIRLRDIPAADSNFTSVEWIGYDVDSFSATANPSWSGVANDVTSTQDILETPGSNLGLAQTIIRNLSKDKNGNVQVELNSTTPAAILFFQRDNNYKRDTEYSPACMGLINENNTSCIWPVSIDSNTSFNFNRIGEEKIVTERYKLAWSAYALIPVQNANGLFDIFLYYNYQPWNNENYTDGENALLMNNVSVFKFTENAGVIQFKLCAQENIGADYNISTCKEKVILR